MKQLRVQLTRIVTALVIMVLAACGSSEAALSSGEWQVEPDRSPAPYDTVEYDNCGSPDEYLYGVGLEVEHTHVRSIEFGASISAGAQRVLEAAVEVDLGIDTTVEERVKLPTEPVKIPPYDKRKIRRILVPTYKTKYARVAGIDDPVEVKVLWAQEWVLSRLPGTGNLCEPLPTLTGLVGSPKDTALERLRERGVDAYGQPIEAWACDAVEGQTVAVRLVGDPLDGRLGVPELVEPAEEPADVRRGDWVEVLYSQKPDSLLCLADSELLAAIWDTPTRVDWEELAQSSG